MHAKAYWHVFIDASVDTKGADTVDHVSIKVEATMAIGQGNDVCISLCPDKLDMR